MTTPTFSRQAFEDVASFLPLFGANSFDFGTWVVRQGSFPFVTYHPEVGRFVRTLERHGWVYESPDFLWGPWLRSPEARALMSGETLGQATPDQLARLLTVFARQERIVDGSRLEMYQSGLLVAILRRVQEWAHQFPWVSEPDATPPLPAAVPAGEATKPSPVPAPPLAPHPSSSLTFSEAARRVQDFISQFEEGYFPPLLMLARLTEETGEIARVLAHQNGKKPKPGEEAGDLEMELADLLFVVICMANERGLSLERGFTRMLDKIERRDRDRWTRKEPPAQNGPEQEEPLQEVVMREVPPSEGPASPSEEAPAVMVVGADVAGDMSGLLPSAAESPQSPQPEETALKTAESQPRPSRSVASRKKGGRK